MLFSALADDALSFATTLMPGMSLWTCRACVEPKCWVKGLGTALCARACVRCDGHSDVMLLFCSLFQLGVTCFQLL